LTEGEIDAAVDRAYANVPPGWNYSMAMAAKQAEEDAARGGA